MRYFLLALLTGFCLTFPALLPASAGEPHRLALQVTDNDPDKMNAALNVAQNVSVYYSSKGQEVEIQIVAFNAGLHMLRDDTSPVKPRLKSFSEGMPNVTFMACQNTLENMSKRDGKTPALVGNAQLVPSGAVILIELSEKGWTILRP
jgi:intracellular sulfur oxidation DsrE/DsrF family protein